MPPIFDQVAATMYISEVHDLTDACLFQLKQLEQTSVRWAELWEVAARARGRARMDHRDQAARDVIHTAQMDKARVQSELFGGVEAFLAAWARLSLIFSPGRSRSSLRTFAAERGAIMRDLYGLEPKHALLDRSSRDNWMHTDERLDHAWIESRLGNRQKFVKTRQVNAALPHTLRVIDVESLIVYTRDQGGDVCRLPLRQLGEVLLDIEARRKTAAERVDALPFIDPD